jgi:DNA-binding Lrp family transcriptional regulator
LARIDNLDLKILKEITSPGLSNWGSARLSYAVIARKLGIDEETVRVRVRRAQNSGPIVGWQLLLNPHLIGKEAAIAIVDTAAVSSKSTIISQLKLLDEVLFLYDFYDESLMIVLYYSSELTLRRRIDLITSICGNSGQPIYLKQEYPSCNAILKKTDWQILKSLRADPMKSVSSIANEVKVSTRTVTRRIAFMTENRAFHSHPIGDIKKTPGSTHLFVIYCPNKNEKSELDVRLSSRLDRTVFDDTNSKEYSLFAVTFPTIREADETCKWIASLNGVKKVSMYLMKEIIPLHDWFDEEIEKHLTN